MKPTLVLGMFLFFIILGLCNYLGKNLAIEIDSDIQKEIYSFNKFVFKNKGQYIQDFETGIWYDIDGRNPKVPPLTIKEMNIKNIYRRIMRPQHQEKGEV